MKTEKETNMTPTKEATQAPSLQMALHQLVLVKKSLGYKESNGDDWLGTPIDTACRAMANIICSWQELERKANAYVPMVEALKDVLKDYYDGAPDSSVGNVLAIVEEALRLAGEK